MTTHDELIARIEVATSWDRQLDDDIADAIYTGKHRVCIAGLTDQAGGMWMFTYPDGSVGSSLRFTGSIDAALTLVPDGYAYELYGGDPNCNDSAVLGRIPKRGELMVPEHSGEATTPALALVAAALKARNA